MHFRLTILIGSLATAAGLGFGMEVQAEDAFAIRDINADGVLSGREAKGLKEFDTDGDDEISEAEFRRAIASWRQQVAAADDSNFRLMDGNEDGRLSGKETANYEFCDLDSDGRITRKEFDQGLAQRRQLLAALPADQMQQSADDYFRTLDTNEDGRLSGDEIVGMARYDADADGRTSKEEWSLGNLMDALSASGPSAPEADPGSTPDSVPAKVGNPVQLLADAANTQSADTLIANLRPELTGMLDAILLQYIVEFIHKHHGRIQPAPKSAIQTRQGENPEEVEFSASVKCEKGKLRLIATMFDGKLLGLQYDSPALDQLEAELYRDLGSSMGVEDGLANRFTSFYSPVCLQLINSVLESKDDEAFALFHPSVQEQVGREAFDGAFKLIRERCGTENKISLTSTVVEEDEDGTHFFRIGHRVTGGETPQILTASFQLEGMRAVLVSISIAAAEEPPLEDTEAPAAPSVKPPVPAPPRLD